MKVGELAKRTGISVRTLHHYDEIGLVSPSHRTESGHRLYGREMFGEEPRCGDVGVRAEGGERLRMTSRRSKSRLNVENHDLASEITTQRPKVTT
jgi:hypothetical protein